MINSQRQSLQLSVTLYCNQSGMVVKSIRNFWLAYHTLRITKVALQGLNKKNKKIKKGSGGGIMRWD